MRYLAVFALLTFTQICSADTEDERPAGWWKASAIVDKVRIFLDSDGRGSLIAEPVTGVSWSHDLASQIVTVKFDTPPQDHARTLRLRYDSATDTLTVLDGYAGTASRTFRRERAIQASYDEEVELSTLPQEAHELIASVRPGSTRAELEKHFRADAGISVSPSRRYYLRQPGVGSKVIMIEVRYESVSSDTIKRVSAPFLSYPSAD